MSFIGNKPDSFGYSSTSYDHFSGTGSQTVYTLTRSVSANADIFVTVNNVPQDPGVAYYVTDLNTLTFTSAPSAVANNIVVVYRNFVQTGLALGANTVTSFTIAPGAVQAYQISSVSNTSISGNITSGQITSVANTQIDGNITSNQIASVSNTAITGNIISSQITSVSNTQLTGLITSTQLVTSAQYMGFKNRIINGGMVIDQRNAGASVSMSAGNGAYCLDRWRTQRAGTGTLTLQQTTTAPVGANNSLKVTITGTSTPSAGDYYTIGQIIEGSNIFDLAWGTANNQPITISFWVQSSVTGTYVASVYNWGASNYTFPATFTINAANTWEQKTVTVTGATAAASGSWFTQNLGSLYLRIDLGSGSNFNGTANAWNSSGGFRTSSSVSLISNSSATFYITNVQLEVGSQATSFDYRDYGRELSMCYRYFQSIPQPTLRGVLASTTSASRCGCPLVVPMRAAPTTTISGSPNLFDGSGVSAFTVQVNYSTFQNLEYDLVAVSTMIAYRPCILYQQGGAGTFLLSAEL
jgi:hypothetical protein